MSLKLSTQPLNWACKIVLLYYIEAHNMLPILNNDHFTFFMLSILHMKVIKKFQMQRLLLRHPKYTFMCCMPLSQPYFSNSKPETH